MISPGRLKYTVCVVSVFLRRTSLKAATAVTVAATAWFATIVDFGQVPAWLRLKELGAQDTTALVGNWSGPVDLPIVPIHMHLLPDGNVLGWGNPDTPPRDGRPEPRVWDPTLAPPIFYDAQNPFVDVYCSGHSFLADGRLLVTGGHLGAFMGSNVTSIFDFSSGLWSPGPDMNGGRWYPTNTTLANGDVVVVSGTITGNQVNEIPQVWEADTGWRTIDGARLALPLYPWMHLAPNGKVFNSGPGRTTRYLDTRGTGGWTTVGDTNFGDREWYSGTSVMYEPGKVMIVGGCTPGSNGWTTGGSNYQCGSPPSASAEVIDLNVSAPQWRPITSMAYPRRFLNATILPDGTVLVTGGNTSGDFNELTTAALEAELWDPEKEFDGDPATPGWSTMAAMSVPRLYHSTALLLPDGRVLVAGGGGDGAGGDVDHYNAEYYSPPYLYTGTPRPRISSAPKTVGYGETFLVATPDAADIRQVTLVRLSSVTHEFNQNQRFYRFRLEDFSATPDGMGLSVTAPSDPNILPPGHYMLFILNSLGVPSIAEIVQVTTRPNNAPTAMNDSFSTPEDTPLTVAAPGVLGNDTDADGDTLSATRLSGPTNGTLALTADGSLTYAPALNFNGTDSFTYTISDGHGGTGTATVSVQVPRVNDAPVASPQAVTTTTGTAVPIKLVATDVDGDPLTYSVVTPTTFHGTLSGTAPNLTYTPNAEFSGSESFTFTASDGTLDSNVATVSITVSAPAVAVAPSSLAFGSVPVGTTSAPQNIQVTNTGSIGASVSSATITGPFTISQNYCLATGTWNGVMAPGTKCDLYVVFAPVAGGLASGTLSVSAAGTVYPVALSGTGLTPSVSVAPSSLSFGSVPVGTTSAPQNIQVTNTGSIGASVSSATITGPFTISQNYCLATGTWNGVMAPGTKCDLYVVFAPAAGGPASGTLSVSAAGKVYPVTLAGTGLPPRVTFERRVAASGNDAEEKGGSVSLTSSDLELVYDGTNQTVGLRFNAVAIPTGANIATAYVQFMVDEAHSDATSLTIQGQVADHAPAFMTATRNISSRPRTTAKVSWSPAPWTTVGAAGPNQRTPDLKAVIQEIVNRSGWKSGNSLVLIITGMGRRTAEAYDGYRAGAPLLHIEYQ